MHKKSVSWYERPDTETHSEDEDAAVVLRKVGVKRDQNKSSSLDPGQETKMSINLPRRKTTTSPQEQPLYFTGPLASEEGPNSVEWSIASLPRTLSRSSYRIGKLNTQLLEAIETGDIEDITRLLKLGANPNATCRLNYVSACHVAAMLNNDSLALLIQFGAESLRIDKVGRTPFHLAAWAGNPKQLAVLLGLPKDLQKKVAVEISPETERMIKSLSIIQHPFVNMPCNIGHLSILNKNWNDSMEHNCRRIKEDLPLFKPGWTALHSACARAQYTCVQLLLAAGAEPNAHDLIARTPLDVLGIAHYSGHKIDVHNFKETLKAVQAAGGKCNSIHVNCLKKMDTPLHTAVKLESKEAIEELLMAGFSVNRLDTSGLTAMHICVEKRLKEHLQLLSNFEYKDHDPYLATVDAKDHLGQTVLHAAVKAGWTDGVCIALGAGANISMKAKDGDSPIHVAAALDKAHILQEIISVANYAIDYRNQKGQTPIFIAIIQNRLNIVKMLIENGASISIVLPDKQNVLHIAAQLGYVDILEYLLNYGGRTVASLLRGEAPNPPIMNAVVNNHPVCVNLLLEKGSQLHWVVPYEDSLLKKMIYTFILHVAAAKNHYRIAKIIISFDIESIERLDENGLLPLHVACIHGNRDIISLFINKGANLSTPALHPKTKLTPMEMIMNNLSKPVTYLEDVFDSYIYISQGKNLHDKECQITVKYDILVPNTEDGRQMKVLKTLVDTGNSYDQRKLLHHPLIESFLYLKWKALVPFFYAIIVLFACFVLSLNVYVVSVFYYKDKNNITNYTGHHSETFKIRPVPGYLKSDAWQYMIYITAILLTIQEIIFIKINKKLYLTLLETWINFGAILLAMAVPFAISWEKPEMVTEGTNPEWARLMATIALLLSWIKLMFLLSRFPSWGFYVLMFATVAKKVFKILLSFVFLIVGFSLCFMIQFRAKSPFEGPWASITKTLVMMTSEYDYMNMINKDNASKIAASILILRLVFITFVILASIVLMNLMVGVAVNDVNNLEDIGHLKRLQKQVEFLTSLEDVVCHRIIRKIPSMNLNLSLFLRKEVMKKIVLRPRQESCAYCKILPRHIKEGIFEKAQMRKKEINNEQKSKSSKTKLDAGNDFVDSKETAQHKACHNGNISSSKKQKRINAMDETITKINADVRQLRNDINIIKNIFMRRVSIH